jgi:predicted negative regulator of RcsB-dependent stress response
VKTLGGTLVSVAAVPVLYEHLGDVYNAMGKQADALKSWNESLRYEQKEEGLKERVEAKIKKYSK